MVHCDNPRYCTQLHNMRKIHILIYCKIVKSACVNLDTASSGHGSTLAEISEVGSMVTNPLDVAQNEMYQTGESTLTAWEIHCSMC